MAPERSGGRRPVDAEINLVPFIDLLCSLIAFLLLTAVWAQVASLELQQTATSDAIADDSETLGLRVFVMEKGFKVVAKDTEVDLPCLRNPCVERAARSVTTDLRIAGSEAPKSDTSIVSNYDFSRLAALIAEKHALFPSEREVYIDVADAVPYDDMIRTMDTCMAAGLTSIALGGSAN
jgi:biopolymer transport protein ExbD